MRLLLSLALLLTFHQLILGDEGSCSKDSGKEDCGVDKDSKYRKTVLITGRILIKSFLTQWLMIAGGSGFVAHHVVETILDTTNWNIVCLDRLDLSGRINRLEEMLGSKDEMTRKRVRVIYADLRADINEQLAKDIGSIQVTHNLIFIFINIDIVIIDQTIYFVLLS